MADPTAPLAIVPSGPLRGEIAAPPSKSAANRALLLAALARGESRLRGPGDSGDLRAMESGLRRLGFDVRRSGDGAEIRVAGRGGVVPAARASLSLGDAGTALRFLLAAASLGSGDYHLDGSPRLRERPIDDLAAALAALGARIRFEGDAGRLPVVVSGGPLRGGAAVVGAGRSSQFTSALLMVAPCTAAGLDLRLEGEPVSGPYVDWTVEWMARFGGPPVARERDRLRVPGGGGYDAADVAVDGDASAAAALLAAAAITGGSVRVTGLPARSPQPDLRFGEVLRRMGCAVIRDEDSLRVDGPPREGARVDLRACPDLAPSVAAVALFARGPSRVTGAAHLRLKESDRIGDLAAGLRRLGARVDEHADGFTIHPGPLCGARLDPRRDHRLAMAFAAIGLRVPGVVIEEPGCVAKSFPGFFDALESLRS
jgi:3-phosphoshikimate 1-carboxyvinyltransferase